MVCEHIKDEKCYAIIKNGAYIGISWQKKTCMTDDQSSCAHAGKKKDPRSTQ